VDHGALVTVFGVLTTLLAVGYGVPQWLKLRKDGNVSGVSLASITCAIVSAVAWVLYGVWLQDIWVVLTSGAAIPGLTAALVALLRNHASREGLWMTWAWAGSLVAAAALVPVTEAPLVVLLGCSILWYVAPALWTAWTSADVSGVAPGAWYLLLTEAAVCAVYGVIADVPAYVVYAAISTVGAGLMLVRLRMDTGCGRCAPLRACSCVLEPA
jgi:uncharacterized protein with PQ loop repeat